MYVLEIETKNKLQKIENPRKARVVDRIFFDSIQVMDNNGVWYTIWSGIALTKAKESKILYDIKSAIKNKDKTIYLDI